MAYNILGINPGHNGSAALISDGEVVYYLEEERLSKTKYDANPFRAILDIVSKWHIDEIVIGGTTSKLPELPWTQEDPYTALVRKFYPKVKSTNLGQEHHIGHAACAFYNSGFDKAIALIVDGAGSLRREKLDPEGRTVIEGYEAESIWVVEPENKFSLVYKVYGNNIGAKALSGAIDFDSAVTVTKAYEAVSQYLGFGFIEAGKTMGLSSYGKQDPNIPNLFVSNRGSKDVFLPYYPAGAFIDYIRLPIFEQKQDPTEWHSDPDKLSDIEKNLAWKIQNDTQQILGNYIDFAIKSTGITKVVIAGGYGLNCVANYYFKKRFPEIELYVEPISHDGGTAIGVAKFQWFEHLKNTNRQKFVIDKDDDANADVVNVIEEEVDASIFQSTKQTSIYYGPTYTAEQIHSTLEANSAKINTKTVTYQDVAKLISDKNIVSIFQGRSEAGPRALGNRSIVYDPRDPDGKDFVNKVKGREWFRPFAGSVLVEDADEWFDMAGLTESPFMMYAVNVVADKVDKIPCITHVDDTCRVQTVSEDQNLHYYNLIKEFKNLTDVPVLFNTSFNLAGQPLVETLDDAILTLENSDLMYLYLPEYELLITKK
jgi:carbamoyltransferase